MKISRWNKKDRLIKKGIMIFVSRQEALCLIRSLTNQLIANDNNVGRTEFRTEDTLEYFSVAVVENVADWE